VRSEGLGELKKMYSLHPDSIPRLEPDCSIASQSTTLPSAPNVYMYVYTVKLV
jgi:hypothetical protein